MHYSLISRIAEENNVSIPFDIVGNPEKTSQFLLSELDYSAKKKILEDYGDAGKALIYFFTCSFITVLRSLCLHR